MRPVRLLVLAGVRAGAGRARCGASRWRPCHRRPRDADRARPDARVSGADDRVARRWGSARACEPAAVVTAFQQGVGNTLGFIAVVIGLGTFVGALLAESGGASVVARAAVAAVGERWLPWCVAAVGFVIGLPDLLRVGLVLLFPVVVGLAATSGRPLLTLALPLVAGLSASHGLVAPHPGPLVAIERLDADTGLSILYGLIAGVPGVCARRPALPARLAAGAADSRRRAWRAAVSAPRP